ncbi:MAG TPA: amidohydrolase family protein, partial [Thermoanaerobaculia bacterium]|nr:amidohydrolase family protein [Thermoanaerobaculia bacterium]
VKGGMAPERALRAATSEAADLLERPDLGRLVAGQTADIVALPGNPLQEIGVVSRVDFVMKAGRILRRP